MTQPSAIEPRSARLVIVLDNVSIEKPGTAATPFRYAAAAAAMDVAVELHAVGDSVGLFRRGAAAPDLLAQIRQASELGVAVFVCPVALAAQGLRVEDLIDEVAGVRGAASLVAAGLAPGARFLTF